MLRIEINNPDIEARIKAQAQAIKSDESQVVMGALAIQMDMPQVLATLPSFAVTFPASFTKTA